MSRSDWTRLAEHLQALEALSGDDRARYIERVAADQPQVAEELRALIPFAERTSGPLDEPAVELDAKMTFPDLAGRSIGTYEIVERIGVGGMGVVYRARRSDAQFDKDVAVKFLSHASLDGEGHRRFVQERQILAQLDHPHIARLLDAGSLDTYGPYVVMELADGRPIDQYCEETKPSLSDILRLFQKVCEAVQSAHHQLIVHRDIKPSNVLVDDSGTPKLLDFGIAKLLGDELPDEGKRTVTRLMTPRYAAPEQLAGQPITTATDVYALGVLLYKLLTGKSPYDAEASDILALQRATIEGNTRPASQAARESMLNPNHVKALEGDIDNILAMAMKTDPAERYASARELAADIENYLTGMPVRARPATKAYRLKKFVRRHRVPTIAIAFIVLVLLAGSIATWIQTRAALAAGEQAQRRYEEVRQLTEALIFDVNDELSEIPGTTGVRKGLVARALDYLEKLRGDVVGNDELAASVGNAYLRVGDLQGHPSFDNLGDSKGAKSSYAAGMEMCDEYGVTKQSSLDLRYVCATLPIRAAMLEFFAGDLEIGAALIEGNRTRLRELGDEHPGEARYRVEYGDALRLLGKIYSWQENSSAAIVAFERAIDVYKSAQDDHPDVPEISRGLASAYAALGSELVYGDRADEGLEYLRQAVDLEAVRARSAPDDPEAQRSYWYAVANLSIEYVQAGQPEKAVEPAELSLSLAQALYDRDPKSHRSQKDLAMARRYLGKVLVETGEALRGRPYLEKVVLWWREQDEIASTPNSARSLALAGLDLADALRGARAEGENPPRSSEECSLLRDSLGLLDELNLVGQLAEVDLDWINIVEERLEACR